MRVSQTDSDVWTRTKERPNRKPSVRRLRGYAYDPSLSAQLDTALVNETVFRVPWEDDLEKGPTGEYVEVIDYDPASKCYYEPVQLNSPEVLAEDGLTPSEGNPQFHQQMVYAVAMTTIRNFERALGRRAQWSLRRSDTGPERGFVQRLRIYPHALREANAYYSPDKRALLFGYFSAASESRDGLLPGGLVFSCLSHDIIAHETTHALLDGMHRRLVEPTQRDALAFHEAFADIVALFQHFSFPEVLRHQISRTRGDLGTESLLVQLAQQFGRAIGNYGALRDAIGERGADGKWQTKAPNPDDYETIVEPHARGAILVSAIFDAFLAIYRLRTADLLRLASGGTGVLAEGALHPDLVGRLAGEASKTAQDLLQMCIRALDYCPPVDVSFGDYLRALITADSDLVPNDELGYRIAIIEAFRRRGILPRDVRTLSVDSLRWPRIVEEEAVHETDRSMARWLLDKVPDLTRVSQTRQALHDWTQRIAAKLHASIRAERFGDADAFARRSGLVLDPDANLDGLENDAVEGRSMPQFEVHSVRPVQRVGPTGDALNQLLVTITQKRTVAIDPGDPASGMFAYRGGCTLIFDLDTERLRYSIYKSIRDEARLERQRRYRREEVGQSLKMTYLADLGPEAAKEPFAFLHR